MGRLILLCLVLTACTKQNPYADIKLRVQESTTTLYFIDDPEVGVRCYHSSFNSVLSCVQVKDVPVKQ